jgi:hypothetical protein
LFVAFYLLVLMLYRRWHYNNCGNIKIFSFLSFEITINQYS